MTKKNQTIATRQERQETTRDERAQRIVAEEARFEAAFSDYILNVGSELVAIKAEFGDPNAFLAWIKQHCGYSRTKTYRTIAIYERLKAIEESVPHRGLNQITLPSSDQQCRPLAKVPVDEVPLVWRKACEHPDAKDGVPNTNLIRQIVTAHLNRPSVDIACQNDRGVARNADVVHAAARITLKEVDEFFARVLESRDAVLVHRLNELVATALDGDQRCAGVAETRVDREGEAQAPVTVEEPANRDGTLACTACDEPNDVHTVEINGKDYDCHRDGSQWFYRRTDGGTPSWTCASSSMKIAIEQRICDTATPATAASSDETVGPPVIALPTTIAGMTTPVSIV